MPTPTLPIYFQHLAEQAELEAVNGTEREEMAQVQTADDEPQGQKLLAFRTVLKSSSEATTLASDQVLMAVPTAITNGLASGTSSVEGINIQNSERHENIEGAGKEGDPAAPAKTASAPQMPARLAYVQLLTNPSQICSALLFFKLLMDRGDAQISRIILYPSIWEEDTSSDSSNTALALMRLVRDDYGIVYYPIKVDDYSGERSIGRELVAHLATENWKYDRVLYLRSPGLALNIDALDSALQASQTKSLLSRNWAQANPEPSTAPSILLVSEHGLHTPRGSNRRLTAEAFTSHANHHEGEMDVEAAAQTAAYVHFEEGELEHRRTEKEWYGGVFERYERGRAEICKGISFDEGRKEIKRVRRRGWR